MKRIYYIFPNEWPMMNNPINVMMTNFALFTEDVEDQRLCCQWLYQILNMDNNMDLIKILRNNPHLKYLTQNAYFSVKSVIMNYDVQNHQTISTLDP